MADFIEDLDIDYPISIRKRSAGTVSAVGIDCAGFANVAVLIVRGSGTGTGIVRLAHASGAATLYASATAFGTNPSASTTGASAAHLMLIQNQPAMKRYLVVRVSAVSTSLAFGIVVLKSKSKAFPITSLGATSLTRTKV